MPRRGLKIKLDKLRLGIAFVLSVFSYNISNWFFEQSYDISIWEWLKSQPIINQSPLRVLLTWFLLLIVPMTVWYKVMGLFIDSREKT